MTDRKVIDLAARKRERLAGREPPKLEVELPDFISPPDIAKMSDAQLEQLVDLIRLRRMEPLLIYEQTQVELAKREEDKVKQQIEKKAQQVFNELDRVFKNLEKLELRVNELRALRLQIGMEF